MRVFKVEISFEPKREFNLEELKNVIETRLAEINYKLLEVEHFPQLYRVPVYNSLKDTINFYIEASEGFDYKVALGCFDGIQDKYINIFSINPSFID